MTGALPKMLELFTVQGYKQEYQKASGMWTAAQSELPSPSKSKCVYSSPSRWQKYTAVTVKVWTGTEESKEGSSVKA